MNQILHIIYDKNNGNIKRIVFCNSENIEIQCSSEESFMELKEELNIDYFYVKDDELKKRFIIDFSKKIFEPNEIFSIQMEAGCKLIFENDEYIFDNTEIVEFSLEEEREYNYQILSPFPYVESISGTLKIEGKIE